MSVSGSAKAALHYMEGYRASEKVITFAKQHVIGNKFNNHVLNTVSLHKTSTNNSFAVSLNNKFVTPAMNVNKFKGVIIT